MCVRAWACLTSAEQKHEQHDQFSLFGARTTSYLQLKLWVAHAKAQDESIAIFSIVVVVGPRAANRDDADGSIPRLTHADWTGGSTEPMLHDVAAVAFSSRVKPLLVRRSHDVSKTLASCAPLCSVCALPSARCCTPSPDEHALRYLSLCFPSNRRVGLVILVNVTGLESLCCVSTLRVVSQLK